MATTPTKVFEVEICCENGRTEPDLVGLYLVAANDGIVAAKKAMKEAEKVEEKAPLYSGCQFYVHRVKKLEGEFLP